MFRMLALVGVICCLASSPVIAGAAETSRFINLSARGHVGSGNDVLIGGFVISGDAPKQVLLRAVGPTLSAFGVSPALAATKISVYSGSREIARSSSADTHSAELQAAMIKAGAAPFAANSLDSALLVSLDPGIYTAIVSAPDGGNGIALLEAYELPATAGSLLTPAKQTQIQQLVDEALTNYEIPGILYAVKFVGEDPWAQARGVRDRATNAALQPDDLFRIGSASKTFAGMAVLRAIEQKRLTLESTLDQLLPADLLTHYPKNLITVRMLLSHTSGINSYTNFIEDWFIPYIFDRTRVWTDRELIQLVDAKFADPDLGQIASPGAVWSYSNTNTVILAVIMEQIYGKPFRQLVQDWFIAPLGLAHTLYPAPGESVMPEPFARGYMNWANYVDEASLPNTDLDVSQYDPSGVGAAGAIVSTVGDLATWMEAIAQTGVGSPAHRRGHLDWKYFTGFGAAVSTPAAGQSSYGLHMAHEPDNTNNADYWIVGHRGQISGYDTAMMYLPEYDCAIVVACTRSLKNAPGFPTNAATVALNGIVNILFPQLIADHPVDIAGGHQAESLNSRRTLRSTPEPKRLRLPLSEY